MRANILKHMETPYVDSQVLLNLLADYKALQILEQAKNKLLGIS